MKSVMNDFANDTDADLASYVQTGPGLLIGPRRLRR